MVPPPPPPDEYEAEDDLALIAKMNAGDEQAFAALYYRYRDWMTNLAFRLTGDSEVALDAMQDSFQYFLGKFPGFTLTCKLKTFFYPVMRHNAIALKQKSRRLNAIDPEHLTHHAGSYEEDNQFDAIKDMLKNLPDAQREVLLLRFVDDLTQPEIAEALGIPLGTVKSRLHHAIKTLKDDPKLQQLFFS